jgi:CheY-like chemotaxis protein
VIRGDPIRVAQVIGNLLSNAAKYTPDGGSIELRVRVAEGAVAISVADNGIGIPPEELADVFNLFMQSADSLARSEGGLGIGLSLARTLTELHGGTIEARSEGIGKGCEFVVQLPLAMTPEYAAAAAAKQATAADAPQSKRRVMIVDDSVDGAESMSVLLEMLGHEVRVLYDGASAISAAPDFKPEVVILDIGLPDLDGYHVARALRSQPETAGALLIALTGYGQESDRQRTRAAGFDHHLVKPASLEDVERVIATDGENGQPRNPGVELRTDATG